MTEDQDIVKLQGFIEQLKDLIEDGSDVEKYGPLDEFKDQFEYNRDDSRELMYTIFGETEVWAKKLYGSEEL